MRPEPPLLWLMLQGPVWMWPHLKSIRLTMGMVTVIFSIRVDEVILHLHGEWIAGNFPSPVSGSEYMVRWDDKKHPCEILPLVSSWNSRGRNSRYQYPQQLDGMRCWYTGGADLCTSSGGEVSWYNGSVVESWWMLMRNIWKAAIWRDVVSLAYIRHLLLICKKCWQTW